jgi:hypothetical protein
MEKNISKFKLHFLKQTFFFEIRILHNIAGQNRFPICNFNFLWHFYNPVIFLQSRHFLQSWRVHCSRGLCLLPNISAKLRIT